MKLGLKFATHAWGYHVITMLISIMFVSSMGSTWFGIVINALLIVGIMIMALNDGAYNGEKACTLAASLEKQVKEGRHVDEKLKQQVFDRKVAAWILIFGTLPFLLISTVNAVTAPFYPEAVYEEESAEEEEGFKFNYDYDSEQQAEDAVPVNPANIVARLVFMPYVSVYSLVSGKVLNALFFLFSLPIALMEAIGYACGPRLRNRKLKDIARGKKRKMRNLKVNKKPRQPKAEV